jgi:hypothetical protein
MRPADKWLSARQEFQPSKRADTMMTRLVDMEGAGGRLAAGEQPYAYEMSDRTTLVGPACGYGTEYLKYLRTQGRYAESVGEASDIAGRRGVTLTGVWFVHYSRRAEPDK